MVDSGTWSAWIGSAETRDRHAQLMLALRPASGECPMRTMLLLALLSLPALAPAQQIYVCKDAKGRNTYQQMPCADASQPTGTRAYQALPASATAPRAAPGVLYRGVLPPQARSAAIAVPSSSGGETLESYTQYKTIGLNIGAAVEPFGPARERRAPPYLLRGRLTAASGLTLCSASTFETKRDPDDRPHTIAMMY